LPAELRAQFALAAAPGRIPGGDLLEFRARHHGIDAHARVPDRVHRILLTSLVQIAQISLSCALAWFVLRLRSKPV
jgi:hypothetical protein